MPRYIVSNTRDATFYRFMENGRVVCGKREPSEFDGELAGKICEQLATLKDDADWRAFEIIGPESLIEKFGTQKACADAIGVCPATIGRWKKQGTIGLAYLPYAHRLLGQQEQN